MVELLTGKELWLCCLLWLLWRATEGYVPMDTRESWWWVDQETQEKETQETERALRRTPEAGFFASTDYAGPKDWSVIDSLEAPAGGYVLNQLHFPCFAPERLSAYRQAKNFIRRTTLRINRTNGVENSDDRPPLELVLE